ncbi:hypothetical protein [Paractinoplanes globisporus]|uniref:Uncharacterized protein n=1 Tax=Paractinoplanes globisporus TaxID=113565 RepID=A0ABW6WJ14_9ACTN|nr:hypothetical protein [Actinoplanes globisporus]
MSEVIIVQFEKHDEELTAAIREAFGEQAEFIEAKRFDAGFGEYVQALLPVVPAVAPLLVAYFTRIREPKAPKRVIVTSTGDMTIEGFNRADVEKLIDKTREE